jgi:hypothetical protein
LARGRDHDEGIYRPNRETHALIAGQADAIPGCDLLAWFRLPLSDNMATVEQAAVYGQDCLVSIGPSDYPVVLRIGVLDGTFHANAEELRIGDARQHEVKAVQGAIHSPAVG